jgi:hypothetical protein
LVRNKLNKLIIKIFQLYFKDLLANSNVKLAKLISLDSSQIVVIFQRILAAAVAQTGFRFKTKACQLAII